MFKCLFCGLENPKGNDKFCVECGPEASSNNWMLGEVDQIEKVTKYVEMLGECYFELSSETEVEKLSMRMRERLKISHAKHVEVLSQLSQEKKEVAHLTHFRFEFNENVTDAYAGHDTFLDFRYTNLSQVDAFKVSLLWDDPEAVNRVGFRTQKIGRAHV